MTNKMKLLKLHNIIYMFLLFIIGTTVNAQQDAQFTQYMYNTISVNPAYAGSRDVLSISGLYRTQWVGLDGAPKTATFALHSPISSKLGLGLSIINDQIGPSDENNISADLSYNIPVSENYKLYFGVKATANLLNIDYTKLDIYNPNDTQFQYNLDNQFSPNVGAGVYLQSEKSYIGISVPYILETKHYNHTTASEAKEQMHYYLIAGHVFNLSEDLKLKPAILTKMVAGAPLQVDVSANFLIHDKLTLGIAYRWDAAFSGLAGFQLTNKLFIGYAYDKDTSKLGNYNSGSHELFLRFELFKNQAKYVSPRFF